MADGRTRYEKLCDEADKLAVMMAKAVTEEERFLYRSRLWEAIFKNLITVKGDKVYAGFMKQKGGYAWDDFAEIIQYLLTPSETGVYHYQADKGGFVSYLNWLCSVRRGQGFRIEDEWYQDEKQNPCQMQSESEYGGEEEEPMPGFVAYLSAVQKRLDLEEGEAKQNDELYSGKIWIKVTYEGIKFIKEEIDTMIQNEWKERNTWNKNKIAYSKDDMEFWRKDKLEDLQDLINYMYPFALSYYYESLPNQTREMYENALYERISVTGYSCNPLLLRGEKLKREHLLYCINQFLAERGERPIKLENMRKWMDRNYKEFIKSIRKQVHRK